MSLFYWVYSKHMGLIKTLLLKLRLGKKAEPLIVLGKKLSNNNNVVVKSLELYWFRLKHISTISVSLRKTIVLLNL